MKPTSCRNIVVMGVCGVGKSTVARNLAAHFDGHFVEGDQFHPPESIRAMSSGVPLTDMQRAGWLEAIADEAARLNASDGAPAFIACSALKRGYRERLAARIGPMGVVHLDGDPDMIRDRMISREDHFMPVALLESQLRDLEPPGAAEGDAVIRIDVASPIEAVMAEAREFCRHALADAGPLPTPIMAKPKTEEEKSMNRITHLALAAATALTLSGSALAQEHTFKFQSSDTSGNANFLLQQEWAKALEEKTDGKVKVELLPVGSVVEHQETQDAIAGGILDGHITDTSYFAGKDPAFGLIANPVGAWSDPQQMFDFMETGGGKELMNELVEPYGLHFIGATTPGLESLVSKVPLEGIDDLKGLKMRAPEGLVQQVFAAAGAAPVNLPGSEVYTSLDKGVIDAADYTVFSTNQAEGLNDIAPHPVYPGFHSMPLVEVSMNKEKWDALPDDIKAAFEESVAEFAQMQTSTLAERDQEAVEKAKEDGKITVHDWSDEERAEFRKIAIGEWEKIAAKSDNAKKVYDVLTEYLQEKGLVK